LRADVSLGIRRFDERGVMLVPSAVPQRGKEVVAEIADGGRFAGGISFQSKVSTLRIPSWASSSSKPRFTSSSVSR